MCRMPKRGDKRKRADGGDGVGPRSKQGKRTNRVGSDSTQTQESPTRRYSRHDTQQWGDCYSTSES